MSTDERAADPHATGPASRGTLPRLDLPVLGAIFVASAAALAFGASRYHLFGDELYFIGAGRHLSVSYADQGPVLPLLARVVTTLGASGEPGIGLLLFRLPAVLVTLAGLVFAALIAREMGGARLAQGLAAAAYATSTFLLLQGELLATNTIDTPLWVAITWCVVRWVRTRRDSLLLVAGVLTAVDMQVKWLIPVFWVCVAGAALADGPRDLLRRPLLWVGGAIAVVATVPALVWQAGNGWPYLQLTSQVADEMQYVGGRWLFVPIMLVMAGVLGLALVLFGLWALARSPRLRAYRFLGIAFVAMVVLFVITGGRPYYPAAVFPVLIAAGAVEFAAVRRTWVRWLAVPVAAVSAVVLVVSLPFTPESDIAPPTSTLDAGTKISVFGQFGWTELASATESAIEALPAADRPQAVVTESYWQAGALEHYGRGLPPVYSASRGYGYLGRPADAATTVLWVGSRDSRDTDSTCRDARPLRDVSPRLGFPGGSADLQLRLCHVRAPWSQLWEGLRHM
ncbi:glycosyltransferase family 39 protein [Tsukamurella sp. 8F]|uniref:glycosyltransferase family 39 protein n=1 Tax=unclassified Tsukamurella TaxID=2633480 RepID=UPI0023B88C99|nr:MULTISPECIES: glycosyltransferase family 39 protein [unclassified Tsukamurella]MDF0532088.1 glycosyltransferase family 39 protein [Tsukamurella sp. 8J]MDF0589200.1 glycosyltransferase family 39 protein [Tsukamurella sp. 8F]